MADITLAAYSYGSVLFDPEVPCITTQWHSFANRQQFQSMMNEALVCYEEESKRTSPLGWLADTRQMSALTSDDQHWLNTDWNPRAYAAGVRHICIVQSENVFGQIAASSYSAKTLASQEYEIHPVTQPTIVEAKHWIQKNLQLHPVLP
ncbi:hypothetical protein [Hymenobacter defluvii]|uniref:STAS/SEC14 domain-containing protein n=1 Tax=Hymenobacter defluvii TaxID=2054411 RepID=A0ABS3TDT2_9BACT|nr:hypothetical protein [Hymenobacter defluvii]MBO3271812.1 hypothetical protein [Hymenobacter defluvii]